MKYLTKKDLNERIYGLEQYEPGKNTAKSLLLFTTSGTTGVPTLIVGSDLQKAYKDTPWFHHFNARLFFNPRYIVGLRNILGSLHPDYQHVSRTLCLDKNDLKNPYLGDLLSEFGPTELSGPVSYLTHIINTLNPLNPFFKNITHIFLSGELASRYVLNTFKKTFRNAALLQTYASSEMGTIGVSCEYITKSVFKEKQVCSKVHPNPLLKVRILEPDGIGVGEIVVSRPSLQNYRTGDMGSLTKVSCACGKDQVLTIYGRYNYDIVHCAGATFLSSQLETVFESLKEYVTDYLVEVREEHNNIETMGFVSFTLVPTHKLNKLSNAHSFILREIASRLYVTKTQTLEGLVQKGLFSQPTITFVESFPMTNKKIHLRKVYE